MIEKGVIDMGCGYVGEERLARSTKLLKSGLVREKGRQEAHFFGRASRREAKKTLG